MARIVYLNGRFVNKKDAKISVFDHGLLYGDGVFEGIRSYGRLTFRLKEHINRLYRSASEIGLKVSLSKNRMIQAVLATLKKNKLDDAYIRLVITRGPGDLGLDPRKCIAGGSVFIIVDKVELYPDKYYSKGLHIVTAKTRKNFIGAIDPRIKSLNYLNNILAKIDGIKKGAPEAIMVTHEGYVSECTGDNIFIMHKRCLYTPPRHMALEGITRDIVIAIARKKKIAFREKKIIIKDIYRADECFLTGTAAEIVPVNRVDRRKIGNGKPGRMTKLFLEEFRKLTKIGGIKY
ncbi:MAG: branched-chain-amino-acid transaminase [Candidatus Omnitrophica bacterium]|nr:branched-chain-amino-acid transaminase [Candidatus Omnitrophota bacterium]